MTNRPAGLRVRPARAADYPAVAGLLEAAGLPTAGLSPSLADFLVAEGGDGLVGAIGLEVYGGAALLRSAVVAAAEQSHGTGTALVGGLLDHARARGVHDVYLLTNTAEDWFPRFGFARVGREVVAAGVNASAEFRGACPDSAVIMRAMLA